MFSFFSCKLLKSESRVVREVLSGSVRWLSFKFEQCLDFIIYIVECKKNAKIWCLDKVNSFLSAKLNFWTVYSKHMFLKLKQRQLYLNFVSPSYSNSYKTYISKAAVSVKIDYKNSIYIVHTFSISSTTKEFCNNSNDGLIDFVFLDKHLTLTYFSL